MKRRIQIDLEAYRNMLIFTDAYRNCMTGAKLLLTILEFIQDTTTAGARVYGYSSPTHP
jgi:hypothetical protein